LSRARAAIDAELSEILPAAGFANRRSEEHWLRRTDQGSQTISIAVDDLDPDFEIEPMFGVRIDAVEDIYHQFAGTREGYRQLSSTTMTPSFRALGVDHFEATGDAELSQVAREIANLVRGRGLPFLNSYRDLTALDRALNVDRIPQFSITHEGSQARTAVIVARLAGNPSFERLVEEHAEAGRKFTHPGGASYDDLAEYLRAI
jgi:hypothetical protein